MSLRSTRVKIAASGSVRINTGRKKFLKCSLRLSHGITFSPMRGNHPSRTTNKKMTNGARTSAGSETNRNDMKLPLRSKLESRLYAWYTPTGMAMISCPENRVEAEEDRHPGRDR